MQRSESSRCNIYSNASLSSLNYYTLVLGAFHFVNAAPTKRIQNSACALASSHPAIKSDTNAFLSSLNYYITSCSRSFPLCQCSIHQAHPKFCLYRSAKYIVLGSYIFLTPFILALVPCSMGVNVVTKY